MRNKWEVRFNNQFAVHMHCILLLTRSARMHVIFQNFSTSSIHNIAGDAVHFLSRVILSCWHCDVVVGVYVVLRLQCTRIAHV